MEKDLQSDISCLQQARFGWLKLEGRNSSRSYTWVVETQLFKPSPLFLKAYISRKLEPGIVQKYSHLVQGSLTQHLHHWNKHLYFSALSVYSPSLALTMPLHVFPSRYPPQSIGCPTALLLCPHRQPGSERILPFGEFLLSLEDFVSQRCCFQYLFI